MRALSDAARLLCCCVKVTVGGAESVLDAPLSELRDAWEATSFELEKLQCA